MSDRVLSRRAFLAATGGLALLAACGSGDDSSGGGGSTTTLSRIDQSDGGLRGLRISSDLYATPEPQRFAFAFTKDDRFFAGPPASIAFRPQDGQPGPRVEARYEDAGLPENRGIYVVPDAVFPIAGIWEGFVDLGGEETVTFFEVATRSAAPVVGAPAPRAASPTVADPLGVDPLCTNRPPCPLHEQSLESLVGAGRPLAVMFATPARCQTQYCGPVLDQLLQVVPAYQDRITFVHVEIYRSATGTQLVPTVEEWGLLSEPWLFGVDASGTITGRLDGAFSSTEISALLDATLR